MGGATERLDSSSNLCSLTPNRAALRVAARGVEVAAGGRQGDLLNRDEVFTHVLFLVQGHVWQQRDRHPRVEAFQGKVARR